MSLNLTTAFAARPISRLLRTGLMALLLGAAGLSAQAAVDVNQASQADLETVRGIGPALSAKILAERQKAAFKDWTDLVDRVRGVGPGSAARLSGNGLTVAGVAYTAAAQPAPARSRRAAMAAEGGAAALSPAPEARPQRP